MSASKPQTPKHGSGHRHPPELRERAVRMVEETIKETGELRSPDPLDQRPSTLAVVAVSGSQETSNGTCGPSIRNS